MAFGVTSTGFGLKDQEQIESEIIDEQIASPDLPAVLDQSSSSPLGQLNGAVSLQLAELWEVAQAMYRAGDPDNASGNALSILSRLTGTTPKEATKATVTLTVNLDAGVTITAGRLVSSSVDSNVIFTTLVDATNSGGAPADVSVAAQAVTAGVIASASIAASTLTVIETPVTGWNTSTNASAATNGTNAETDDVLRLRRADELTGQGASNVDSIRAAVSAITTVTDAEVFENTTLITDGDGVPGKAFDTVVSSSGSDDNNIAQAIWDNRPIGIQAYGSTSTGTALDQQDNPQTVAFTRATEKDIEVEVDITKNTATYPTDGDDQIKAAILAVINALGISDDVYQSPLISATMTITGVVNVPDLRMAIKPASPSTVASLAIGTREIARIVVGDITVTAV
jgi:uncharacterized phage protein gp47/JayE